MSVDVEGEIYRLAGRSGIALFTVSHRKSLWEHHSVSFDTLERVPTRDLRAYLKFDLLSSLVRPEVLYSAEVDCTA